jgi:hypothetical protein
MQSQSSVTAHRAAAHSSALFPFLPRRITFVPELYSYSTSSSYSDFLKLEERGVSFKRSTFGVRRSTFDGAGRMLPPRAGSLVPFTITCECPTGRNEAMRTRKDIEEAQKLTEQEFEDLPGAPVAQRSDEAKTLLPTCAQTLCVIDFFTAREWLQAGFGESSQRYRIHREIDNSSTYRLPGVEQVDRFEESLYWLLSAAMIIYFMLGIIG